MIPAQVREKYSADTDAVAALILATHFPFFPGKQIYEPTHCIGAAYFGKTSNHNKSASYETDFG